MLTQHQGDAMNHLCQSNICSELPQASTLGTMWAMCAVLVDLHIRPLALLSFCEREARWLCSAMGLGRVPSIRDARHRLISVQ